MVSEHTDFLLDSLISAQREIETLRNQLTDLADRRSEWMAMLSHELRTPLSLISGYGRLMLSGEAGPITAKQDLYLTESAKGWPSAERVSTAFCVNPARGGVPSGRSIR